MVYNDGNVSRFWEENCCLNQKLALAGKKNEIILLRDKEKKTIKQQELIEKHLGENNNLQIQGQKIILIVLFSKLVSKN